MYVCKNLLNLDCEDSIRFGICKMKGHLGRVSPSHFFAKCFDINFMSLF